MSHESLGWAEVQSLFFWTADDREIPQKESRTSYYHNCHMWLFFPAVNGDLLVFVAAVKMVGQDGLGVEVGSETGIAPHPRRAPLELPSAPRHLDSPS